MPFLLPAKRKVKDIPQLPLLNPEDETITRNAVHNDKLSCQRGVAYGFHTAMKQEQLPYLAKDKDVRKASGPMITVAELVKDKALLRTQAVRDAANLEWEKLEKRYCWDVLKVQR